MSQVEAMLAQLQRQQVSITNQQATAANNDAFNAGAVTGFVARRAYLDRLPAQERLARTTPIWHVVRFLFGLLGADQVGVLAHYLDPSLSIWLCVAAPVAVFAALVFVIAIVEGMFRHPSTPQA